ncbi:unnamed protein product [Cylicocyclus nassatus]|uniref:Uncharacterized protein n=1 Tax=Cylicocyclus nassatus TaxID=53992 RepID=A0AA36HHB6_CYLNA|nr:unnamed protein product [Cylicocyclus nassatus]
MCSAQSTGSPTNLTKSITECDVLHSERSRSEELQTLALTPSARLTHWRSRNCAEDRAKSSRTFIDIAHAGVKEIGLTAGQELTEMSNGRPLPPLLQEPQVSIPDDSNICSGGSIRGCSNSNEDVTCEQKGRDVNHWCWAYSFLHLRPLSASTLAVRYDFDFFLPILG